VSRRKPKRRERLERREVRKEAGEAGAPAPEAPAARRRRNAAEGVSFSGAAGGLLGAGMFFALAAAILIDPGDGSRLWSIAFAFAGLCFLPAAAVSIVSGHPRRRAVLRASTIVAMLIAGLGLAFFGIGFALIMAPPTVLLAVGAGYILQGTGARA
jgi:hypothetical protein